MPQFGEIHLLHAYGNDERTLPGPAIRQATEIERRVSDLGGQITTVESEQQCYVATHAVEIPSWIGAD